MTSRSSEMSAQTAAAQPSEKAERAPGSRESGLPTDGVASDVQPIQVIDRRRTLRHRVLVPLMLCASSAIMAFAWLGHLRLKHHLTYVTAIIFAWLLVLPEYMLNIKALRMGYGPFTGAQMAAFRLCSGVVAIALVSRFFLGEELGWRKLAGFALMMVAMVLIAKDNVAKDNVAKDNVAKGSTAKGGTAEESVAQGSTASDGVFEREADEEATL